MLNQAIATVVEISSLSDGAAHLITEYGPAIAYSSIVGPVHTGDSVLLNRTANILRLGTGGVDFVIAVAGRALPIESADSGHIMKLRYTPSQLAVHALEEDPELEPIWEKSLDGFPVVVCQLHSQIAHAAAALAAAGRRVVYIMTDTACMAAPFSRLLAHLKAAGIVTSSITAGQAFGGDHESVTVHSALLAAKYFLNADAVIVGQGPGNAGTGTKYGFSSIDQAGLLDIVSALYGTPIAVLRLSNADQRVRHHGVSHHSLTALKLVRSSCVIPVPAGIICEGIEARHTMIEISDFLASFDCIEQRGVAVTTMGRGSNEERLFFEASAAAGVYAASLGESN